MRGFITIILFTTCVFANAQSLDSIKHIEVVSEIQDSMVLLNKADVDKINKVFYEKSKLDSLRKINENLIETLVLKNSKLDSILNEQKAIIQNEVMIKNSLESRIVKDTDSLKLKLKNERIKKICGQTTTGICILTLLIILI